MTENFTISKGFTIPEQRKCLEEAFSKVSADIIPEGVFVATDNDVANGNVKKPFVVASYRSNDSELVTKNFRAGALDVVPCLGDADSILYHLNNFDSFRDEK